MRGAYTPRDNWSFISENIKRSLWNVEENRRIHDGLVFEREKFTAEMVVRAGWSYAAYSIERGPGWKQWSGCRKVLQGL